VDLTVEQWNEQGWDRAEFTCGRCFTTITATAEDDFPRLVGGHKANCPSPSA
jgi:hypothetical protein